ncbi:hypothetical protein AUJ14_01635 [Candidatus Micrarchaeota archaeon CG1_02_55_22]|nr:MAG: hypothetical protein AUJ14_01635 [Candidatus Micrarchaeota archaeon CG1_02_55_22]
MNKLDKWTVAKGIEFGEDFNKALALLERPSGHVFVTGKAGTGKSTLLKYFRSTTSKKVAVLAPTGVAAVNVEGQTIHSFFGFRPNTTESNVRRAVAEKQELFKSLDAVIIDEASMVRADLLDCIDKSLRLNRSKREPFGGVQMLFFGDLHQLPPVVTESERDALQGAYDSPYFFDSNALRKTSVHVFELEKVYRQKDAAFIELLNAIRTNTADENHLGVLNSRVTRQLTGQNGELCVTLTATNDVADSLNQQQLASIRRPPYYFEATRVGAPDKARQPAPVRLELKLGCQVMLLNNDSAGRWVNGTVGVVNGFSTDEEGRTIIGVQLPDGTSANVGRFKWTLYKYALDPKTKAITAQESGSFSQYPLRLAWAVTVHKSQGKTFDRVHVDSGRGMFAPGQLYVALSRCRTLGGITLARPIQPNEILTDERVSRYARQERL